MKTNFLLFLLFIGIIQPITLFSQVNLINPNKSISVKAGPFSGVQTYIPPPQDYLLNPNYRTAFINVTYDAGFNQNLPAKAAFQRAVDILSTLIFSSVVIEVKANFIPLSTGTLGSARPANLAYNFSPTSNYDLNTLYPIALANKIAQYDLDPINEDIVCNFNINYNSWYFGTNGSTPFNKYDFVTVVLHELMHGLGFYSLPDVNSNGIGTLLSFVPYYSIYDKFVQNTGGQSIKSFPEGSIQLGNQLTGNALTWNGYNAYNQNTPSGLNPKIYSPATYSPPSSYAHWNENYFFQGNANSLMTPNINMGESIHDPGNVSIGLLKDIGWAVTFTTGIGDYITINPFNVQLTQGSTLNLYANFYDQNEPSYVVEYWYELEVYKSGGKYIHKSKAKAYPTSGLSWSFNIAYLPYGPTWIRGNNGDVLGKITVFTKDQRGYTNFESVPISIKHVPEKPEIQLKSVGDKSLTFSYYSYGATNYTIYYDTDPGQPYSGNQAIQGSSGFSATPGLNTITLSNLTNNINYYLSIKGVNTAGFSVYSNELLAMPTNSTGPCNGCNATNRSINDDFKIKSLIFPNPANRTLNFITKDLIEINIKDITGKTIREINLDKNFSDEEYTLNCEDFANGIYLAVFLNKYNQTFTEKLIIQHQ